MGETASHMRHLAERVYLLSWRQGVTQRALAKRAGMSTTTLHGVVKQKARSITVEHLIGLATVLETTPDVLLGYAPLQECPPVIRDAQGETEEE